LVILSRIRFAQKATAIRRTTPIREQWNFVIHEKMNFHEWAAATLQILLVGIIRVYSKIGGSNIQRMDIRAGWGHSFSPRIS